jgi:hypothetical protein
VKIFLDGAVKVRIIIIESPTNIEKRFVWKGYLGQYLGQPWLLNGPKVLVLV